MNHKKLLLTLTLCLCALLCMVVTASASEVSVHTNHFSCGVVGCQNNDHGHTQVTEWQPWTGPQSASKDNIPYDSNTKTAYIYLANNVEIEDALTIPRGHTLYLCLNGHDIIRTGNLIQIQEDASFTLCDCKGDKAEYGKLDSNKGGRVVSFESGKPGTFTMYGGNITGNYADTNGGGVHVVSETANFTMYGGSITGNHTAGSGGGVNVNAGTMIVRGDINISGNWKGTEQSSASNDNANNVYLPTNSTITIEKALTGENSRIGVTTATPVATTKDASVKIAAGKGTYVITDKDKGHFTPDTGYCEVQKKDDGALYLTHVHSGGEATCTAAAKCGGCGQQYGNTNLNNHALVHHEAKAPTCTAVGWEAYDTCSRCTYTTYREIPAAHTYGETWVKGQDGHWKVCEVCQNRSEVEPHNWRDATTSAPKTCTVCGATTGTKLSTHYYYSPAKTEDTPASPKAGDPGVLLYAGLALASLTGLACTAKKRH